MCLGSSFSLQIENNLNNTFAQIVYVSKFHLNFVLNIHKYHPPASFFTIFSGFQPNFHQSRHQTRCVLFLLPFNACFLFIFIYHYLVFHGSFSSVIYMVLCVDGVNFDDCNEMNINLHIVRLIQALETWNRAMEKNMDLKKKGVITSILMCPLCNHLTEETTTFLQCSHSCEFFTTTLQSLPTCFLHSI